MKDEAIKVLQTMPDELWYTQDANQCYVLDGAARWGNLERCIIRFGMALTQYIKEYSREADMEVAERIAWMEKELKIYDLIAPVLDKDHIIFAIRQVEIAGMCCELGDTNKALMLIEKAVEDTTHHIDAMDPMDENGNNYMAWPTPRNLPWILWEEHLAKPVFDIIRDNERFVKCFEWLKENSRELK